MLITGDGSIMMNCQEFATIADNDIDIKGRHRAQFHPGMSRTVAAALYSRHYSASELKGKTDYVKLARSDRALRGAHRDEGAARGGAAASPRGGWARLIDVIVPEEADVVPMVPGGSGWIRWCWEGR